MNQNPSPDTNNNESTLKTTDGKNNHDRPPELNDNDRALLIMEYQQLCQDWRQRDKNLLDKLVAAGILFALLGVVVSQSQFAWVQLILLAFGGFFSFTCTVSTINDIKYRDGTEQLIRGIARRLNINEQFSQLGELKVFDKIQKPNYEKIQKPNDEPDFSFLRKVPLDTQHLILPIPIWLKNWLTGRHTFNYVLWFYLISTLSFLVIFLIILFSYLYYLIWNC
jgi:hypothetical protein